MKILELAAAVLEHAGISLTHREIWNRAVALGLDKKLDTRGNTQWNSLSAQLYTDVKEKEDKSIFVKVYVDGTTKFGLRKPKEQKKATLTPIPLQKAEVTLKKPEAELTLELSPKKAKGSFLERDLHPFLAYFASKKLKCQTKTINHSVSTKKEFGEWVHPDMVGCYFPHQFLKHEVWELSKCMHIAASSAKLYSFELKRELNLSNLRESFFQAVSNSSWANEGFLVAANISKDPGFLIDLSRLSTSFGIGIIELNVEDPDLSQILFPAKQKDSPDLQMIEKLTMNNDYVNFISTVKIDMDSKKVHHKEYDDVLDVEMLKASIK